MDFPRRFAGLFACVVVALLVAACEEDEQNRVLVYDKGTYLGAEDSPLPEATVRELQSRAREQRF